MRLAYLAIPLALAGCLSSENGSGSDLTSSDGSVYTIDFDSFVDVQPGAPDSAAKDAIHLQVKSALGALREQNIGIQDRDAQDNLASVQLTRQTFQIAGGGAVDRVHYHYHDTALVEHGSEPTGPITLTMLYGNYVANASKLIPICSDDQTTDADSLWYHYQPGLPQCAAAISAGQRAIDSAQQGLAAGQISAADANRQFLTVRATLAPQAAAPDKWPEYDQLWGFAGDTSRQMIVVYSFFGVNADENDPADLGLVEYLRFERYLRQAMPDLQVSYTSPQAMLLDFYVDGQKLPNVSWSDVENWVVDGTGFPAQVGTDATKRAALLQQVQQAFTDRWIYWTGQATATRNGQTRTMTIQIRTWHGVEDGSDDIRLHARWRYLEAFWNADVFSYTGHSHFGHGPLEPWEYDGSNFPDRYQVMLLNSCLSFNYYDVDFLRMHPEGSAKLDVVVNGLPAYWQGMGESTAAYVAGLVAGTSTYKQLLSSMAVDLPWQNAYDPMRAVNGELDNTFDPSQGAITIAH